MATRALRIAATADVHYAKHSRGLLHEAFAEISQNADMLLLCGDLTDYGLPEEAEELVADIRAAVRIPTIAVLVIHVFESGQPELVSKVLDDAGVNVLNGEAIEIAGIGFAGIAGFGGGFGRRMLNAWGEPLIKQFVQESISHAVRLEQALANYNLKSASQWCLTLRSAPRYRVRIRRFMRFLGPADWKSRSIDSK